MKVLMSAARSSPAPILVKTPSKQYISAESAGTKLPTFGKAAEQGERVWWSLDEP